MKVPRLAWVPLSACHTGTGNFEISDSAFFFKADLDPNFLTYGSGSVKTTRILALNLCFVFSFLERAASRVALISEKKKNHHKHHFYG